MTDNSKSEHNNTDEESIDIDENESDSDEVDNLTNSINKLFTENSENIESTKEDDKEFAEYQVSGSGH